MGAKAGDRGNHSQSLTLETRPAVRLGEQSGKLRNKEQAGMGERWVGRKEGKPADGNIRDL